MALIPATLSAASFSADAALNLNCPWALGLTLHQSSCLPCRTPGTDFIPSSELFSRFWVVQSVALFLTLSHIITFKTDRKDSSWEPRSLAECLPARFSPAESVSWPQSLYSLVWNSGPSTKPHSMCPVLTQHPFCRGILLLLFYGIPAWLMVWVEETTATTLPYWSRLAGGLQLLGPSDWLPKGMWLKLGQSESPELPDSLRSNEWYGPSL